MNKVPESIRNIVQEINNQVRSNFYGKDSCRPREIVCISGYDAFFFNKIVNHKSKRADYFKLLISKALRYNSIYIIKSDIGTDWVGGGRLAYITVAFKPHYRYNWKTQQAERVK